MKKELICKFILYFLKRFQPLTASEIAKLIQLYTNKSVSSHQVAQLIRYRLEHKYIQKYLVDGVYKYKLKRNQFSF